MKTKCQVCVDGWETYKGNYDDLCDKHYLESEPKDNNELICNYLTEDLGFVKFDIDFSTSTTDCDTGLDFVFVHYGRKTIIAWTSGFDVKIIDGDGLTEEELGTIEKFDR